MNLPHKIYMIGIGGIGMSALAQLLASRGHVVSGSDRDGSPTTELLAAKGIAVIIGQKAENVPRDAGLTTYSDAIYPDHPERMQAKSYGIPEMSYFEALGDVSQHSRTLAVAGTHGKTTTTGMLAKMLRDTGKHPTAIVGSIVRDFESNFLPGDQDLFVVEACEYRDHVLKLSPQILVVTNIELDHTDYFPDLASIQKTFRVAMEKVPKHGAIVTNPHDPNIAPLLSGLNTRIADYTQQSIPTLRLIGQFNEMNAKAAKAAAMAAFPDLRPTDLDASLADFHGAWRRFEYKGETPNGAQVYDDYAHHPTAIEKTIEGARERFPGKRIVVAFHPHLYSRTKSLLSEFAHALAQADTTIVAPIYAAREQHDPTINNHIVAELANEIGGQTIALDSFDEIRDRLLEEPEGSLIITMGAGDIYKVAEEITEE